MEVMNGNGDVTHGKHVNGHNGSNGHTHGSNDHTNGSNGYHHDSDSSDKSDTDPSNDPKLNGSLLNGTVKVTKLNGQSTKEDQVDISQLSKSLGLDKAIKEAQNPNAAGVIIFQDQNGVAPPITMTIMKGEEEGSDLGTCIVNQSYTGGQSEETTPTIKTVNFDHENFQQQQQQPQGNQNGERSLKVGKSILKQDSKGGATREELGPSIDMEMGKSEELEKSKFSPVSAFSFVGPARRKLRDVARRKQEDQQAQFDDLRSRFKLNQDARTILSLDWTTLIEQLQQRKLTSVNVLSAFIAKSLEATAYCNAITDFCPKAMEIAEKLDAMPEVKGPLHGIPFCVKDDTNVEGMDSTLGFAKNCYKPKTESAALVKVLEKLGAVPYCKTNVPQTLLSFGSDNPVFGVTTSSHNNKLGPGGSSSGTGALVGSFGCFFGTGTDIGGSLRMPSHFNGVSTLKPTTGRCTVRGLSATLPNIMGLDATTGIIGRNAQVVSDVTRLIFENNLQSQFDPKVLPIPWNNNVFSSTEKLRIGYFTQMPFFPPIGDTIATVEKAVAALKSLGHTLVPMKMPEGSKIMRVAANYILADDSEAVKKLWKGEEIAKCAELNELGSKCPHWIIRIFAKLLQQKFILPWIYSTRLASMLDAGSFTSSSLWANKDEQRKITEEILSEWSQLNLNCCVCPVMPFPAVPLDLPGLIPMATLYTMCWNVVDFPAGVVKFGTESGKNIDSYDTEGDQALKLGKNACKESVGSPIGVQVVGLPYQEEQVLRVMKELDSCFLGQ